MVQYVTALTEFYVVLRRKEISIVITACGELTDVPPCMFCLSQSVIKAYLRKRGFGWKVTSVLSWRQVSLH